MRERPILFSAPMVRAILDGRKTVTRRTMKTQPSEAWQPATYDDVHKMRDDDFVMRKGEPVTIGWGPSSWDGEEAYVSPYGQPGDLLWVREAWRAPASLDDLSGSSIADKCLDTGYRKPWCPLKFEATGDVNSAREWRYFGAKPGEAIPGRYRHARFMPHWASRITLELTSVRVERVQEISDNQAIAEGIERNPEYPTLWKRGDLHGDQNTMKSTGFPKLAFRSIWEAINGHESWSTNPWVWVVEFKRLEQSA
jgi:hypothetical protein